MSSEDLALTMAAHEAILEDDHERARERDWFLRQGQPLTPSIHVKATSQAPKLEDMNA